MPTGSRLVVTPTPAQPVLNQKPAPTRPANYQFLHEMEPLGMAYVAVQLGRCDTRFCCFIVCGIGVLRGSDINLKSSNK